MNTPRPVFDPTFNWGTIFTIVGGLVVAGGLWVGLEVANTKSYAATQQNKGQIESIEQRVSRLEGRLDKRLDTLDSKLDRLIAR
jgi:hypothetical protein